jgi:DNA-binding CsgD family transcriptional regulator
MAMQRKPVEFYLMFAVIAITAWHVRSFLATKDAELASWVIGGVLGACCFLFAHRFFSGGAARAPAFVALIVSSLYSVNMQYAFFDAKDIAEGALTYDLAGWNLNALVLGLWAPTFEILLGWLFSAMTKGHSAVTKGNRPSRWDAVFDAAAMRAAATLKPKSEKPAPQPEAHPATESAQPAQVDSGVSANALQAAAMRENGMKVTEIAGALQVSERTVYNLLKSAKKPVLHTNGHGGAS